MCLWSGKAKLYLMLTYTAVYNDVNAPERVRKRLHIHELKVHLAKMVFRSDGSNAFGAANTEYLQMR